MKKRIFWAIGIIILIVAVIGGINFYPLLSMKPAETGEIGDTEIIAVKNRSNSVYFIESNDGYILIDAGSDISAMEKSLEDVGIAPNDVKHVFLTHSDSDHVAALLLFSNAEIYMSEDELQMINGETKRDKRNSNSLPDGIKQDAIVLLTQEQELTIGEHKVICIKAPGHTPGSIVYILDDDYLFSGDSFKINNDTIDIHPFTMDSETSEKTIQDLYSVIQSTKFTLTAHYGYYKSVDLVIE